MGNSTLLRKASTLILFFVGLWLVASPFVLNYFSLTIAKTNDFYTGLAILVLSLISVFAASATSLAWLVGVAGLWEISAPFVLGYSANSAALNNAVFIGLVVVALSLWQILLSPEEGEIITRHFPLEGYGPSYASEIKRRNKAKEARESLEKDAGETFENQNNLPEA